MQHINKIKDKNHTIISINADNFSTFIPFFLVLDAAAWTWLNVSPQGSCAGSSILSVPMLRSGQTQREVVSPLTSAL
jgi:hypothetical protein